MEEPEIKHKAAICWLTRLSAYDCDLPFVIAQAAVNESPKTK
jgi:hypothetical protein